MLKTFVHHTFSYALFCAMNKKKSNKCFRSSIQIVIKKKTPNLSNKCKCLHTVSSPVAINV